MPWNEEEATERQRRRGAQAASTADGRRPTADGRTRGATKRGCGRARARAHAHGWTRDRRPRDEETRQRRTRARTATMPEPNRRRRLRPPPTTHSNITKPRNSRRRVARARAVPTRTIPRGEEIETNDARDDDARAVRSDIQFRTQRRFREDSGFWHFAFL